MNPFVQNTDKELEISLSIPLLDFTAKADASHGILQPEKFIRLVHSIDGITLTLKNKRFTNNHAYDKNVQGELNNILLQA